MFENQFLYANCIILKSLEYFYGKIELEKKLIRSFRYYIYRIPLTGLYNRILKGKEYGEKFSQDFKRHDISKKLQFDIEARGF